MSSELGTFEFLPHITLVAAMEKGEDDAVWRTKALAAELAPYSFEIDEIWYRDAYFQCVYAKMKRTDAVVHANTLAREFFPERRSDPDYMPHLSLVYGDFDEATKQNEIIPKLRKLMMTDGTDQYSVVPVDAIEVWSTQGDAKDWYRVESIPLTGNHDDSGNIN
jgi:2'-5' RNA ligase